MYLVPLSLIDRPIEKVEHPHALVQLVLQRPSQMVQGARVKK